ncbi:MAG: hypothetical protein FRX49_11853 [Trebouxia sp. A1-2]|nr:MAG: hypothetical protein FRX49_11853 [Trebouxia sp. A1-2]
MPVEWSGVEQSACDTSRSRQNNTSRQTGACDIDRYNMAATQRTLHSAMSGIASSSVLYKTKAGAVDIPIYSDGQHLQFSFDKDLTLRGGRKRQKLQLKLKQALSGRLLAGDGVKQDK